MYSFLKINNEIRLTFFISCLCLLFAPKINIISFGPYEGAGVRLDDFILFAGFLLLIITALISKEFKVTKFEVVFYIFVSSMLLSYLLNYYYNRGSILYVLRFLEYIVFFYAGVSSLSVDKLKKFLVYWIFINALISLLQYAGIIGGVQNGVVVASLERATGLTNNATETAMVALLIFVFYSSINFHENIGRYITNITIIFGASLISIGLSGSRLPLAILFIYYIYSLMKISKLFFIGFSIIIGLSISSIIGVVAVSQSEKVDTVQAEQNIQSRLQTLLTPGTLDVVSELIKKISYENQNFSNSDVKKARKDNKTLLEGGADLSLLIRLTKWVYATKSFYYQGPIYWTVGVGPGVWYNALDGGLLRIMTENGIIGLAAFLSLYIFRPRYKSFDPARPVLLAFFLGNIFIDHYLFYKVMSCLLLIIGAIAYQAWKLKEEDLRGNRELGKPDNLNLLPGYVC